MKYSIILIVLITQAICVRNTVQAQDCIRIDDVESTDCLSFNVIESNPQKYVFNVKIHKLISEKRRINGETYNYLSIDGGICTQNIGEPSLPIICRHIGIPASSTFDVEIVENKWNNIQVGKLFPTQKPLTEIPKEPLYVISDSIYNVEQYDYPTTETSNKMRWRGIDNIYLKLCPFKYYPTKKTLSVLSDFTVVVTFIESKEGESKVQKHEEKDLYIFDNKEFIESVNDCISPKNVSSNETINYLIIVGNMPTIMNSQAMKDFRKWKALKGFKSKLVSTQTIGCDSASIKCYIKQQYDQGIRYVLFVGDHTKIPLPVLTAKYIQNNHQTVKSDYWYGCLDGINDTQAELPIGRFATNTLTDFTNLVNKTIKYESLYHSWANKVLLTAHVPQESNYFQPPLQTIYDTYNNIMFFQKAFAGLPSQGGTNATITDVENYINSGMNIVTVNSHGNAGGFWLFDGSNSTMFYNNSNLNADTYPIFLSLACFNGDITETYSIAKYFTCSDHCASAFVGGTELMYIYADNEFIKKLYSKLLTSPQTVYLGDLLIQAHIANLSYGNMAVDNAFAMMCIGDPTMEIWTGNQSSFSGLDVNTVGNNLSISVSNAQNFKVCVVSSTGELQDSYISSGSSISIPKPTTECYLSVTKHDFIPYVVHINPQDLYIQNVTFTDNEYYIGTPINIGYDVTTSESYGNVILQSGAKVKINKGSGVTIKNGFECKQGAEFIIK